MQTIKCTFVLLVVVMVQCAVSDPCFKKECTEAHLNKTPEEKAECEKKMMTDGKLDAEKMKAEFKKCANEKYLEKMNEYADKVNGKEMGDTETMKKEFEKEAGCELGF